MKKYHSPKELLDAAHSELTSVELDALLSWNFPFVNEAVASNPNTALQTLCKLIPQKLETWNQQSIAIALADNPNSSSEILHQLSHMIPPVADCGRDHHRGFEAGIHICCNHMTPIEDIRWLLTRQKTAAEFRKVLARQTDRLDTLEILCTDKSERTRRMALRKKGGQLND